MSLKTIHLSMLEIVTVTITVSILFISLLLASTNE